MTDVGLYIHVPFCPRKCGYCDFYSIVPSGSQAEDLVDAMLVELDRVFAEHDPHVETIFVGGGTPTSLSEAALGRLAIRLRRVVDLHHPVEFSVEANPVSLNELKAALLREAGVTRISMGAQSFDRGELRALDRLHAPEDITAGVELVRRCGFEHFNLDLIFGVPGQTLQTWADSLRRTVELGPDHVACYGLTYEPGTPLTRRRDEGTVIPADEDLETDMYLFTIDFLAEAGYEQYEISNFARPGGRCRHNLRYWHNQPGLGIGPAAASYLAGRRWRNVAGVDDYVRCIRAGTSTVIDLEALSPLERAGEAAMLRLRTVEGIRYEEFREQTGFDPRQLFAEAIRQHVESGLMRATCDRVALSRKGLPLADAVIRDFLLPAGF
jgi:oxygen-independent coproporphyrinogen III oxidase